MKKPRKHYSSFLLAFAFLIFLISFPDQKTMAASSYTAWSDWSDSNPEQKTGRQIETRQVRNGAHMVYYGTQDTSLNRCAREYSVNGNYAAYGLRSSYGEFKYTVDFSEELLTTAKQYAPGAYVPADASHSCYNRGNAVCYQYSTTDVPWFIESEIYKTQYRYRDAVTTPTVTPVSPTPVPLTPVTPTKPTTPSTTNPLQVQITLRISNTASGINLQWNKIAGATGYYIYRNGKKIATISSSGTTTYTDKKVKQKVTYIYDIRIYIKVGTTISTGNPSDSVSICFLPQMKKPKITAKSSGLTVSWTKSKICTGYEIEYSTNANFANSSVIRVPKSKKSYTLSNLQEVRYYIRIRIYITINGVTSYSSYSTYSYAKPKAPTYLYQGTITDALTGKNIKKATLYFRKNSKKGKVCYKTKTNANGQYNVHAKRGKYVIEVKKSGYTTFYITVYINVNVNYAQATPISISKSNIPTGKYRAVLTWGANPRDLDSHLYGKAPNIGQYHIYFGHKLAQRKKAKIMLDIDDTNGQGPETTTFSVSKKGTYTYSVHDFTNRGLNYTRYLSYSGARVALYKGNKLIAVFSVPQGEGNTWKVFQIKKGKLKKINQLSHVPQSSDLTKY